MKLYLESYLDIVIMNILQIHGWNNYPEANFWGSPSGCFSQITAYIHLVLMIAFPLFGGIKIWTDHKSLDEPETL